MSEEARKRKAELADHQRALWNAIDAGRWDEAHYHAQESEKITRILVLIAKQALEEAAW